MILIFIRKSIAQAFKYFEFLFVHKSFFFVEFQNLFLGAVNFNGVVEKGGSHCVVSFFNCLGLGGAVNFTSGELLGVPADEGSDLVDV